MTILSIALTGIIYLWGLLKEWLYIFASPVDNFNILWIIIPIWLSWFFAEFFQEKHGTSFGNAISNGVVPLWVGVDWTRYLVNSLIDGTAKAGFWTLFAKFALCGFIFAYGLTIILFGIKSKEFIHFFGRIREVTYVQLVFSPIIYGIIPLTWKFMILIVVFFPIFYYFIELICLFTPDPKAYKVDEGEESKDNNPAPPLNMPNSSFPGQGLENFNQGMN